jgi:hypothetical protein
VAKRFALLDDDNSQASPREFISERASARAAADDNGIATQIFVRRHRYGESEKNGGEHAWLGRRRETAMRGNSPITSSLPPVPEIHRGVAHSDSFAGAIAAADELSCRSGDTLRQRYTLRERIAPRFHPARGNLHGHTE